MAVVAVVLEVAKQLGNLLGEEAKYLWGVEEQVKSLESELSWVHSFLKEAEEANQMEDKLVCQRVLEIRDIAYDIQDVVEEFTLRIASKRSSGCIKRCIGFPREMKRLHHIRSKMNKISKRLNELKRRTKTYGTHKSAKPRLQKGETSSSFNRNDLRRSYAHVREDNLVGIDKGLKALVPLLTDDHVKVVCIHGMGGLGKTTLAKAIYHDPQVRLHCNHFAWVYISPQFSREEKWEDALKDLGVLESAPSSFFKAQRNSQELAKRLHDFLKANKCLLVLDDVWNTGDLDALMPGFPMTDNNKSRILITSRYELDVAQRPVWKGGLHQLQSLDEDQSWDLLQKIVFTTGHHDKGNMNDEMVEIGRKIAKRCQGLPLALKAIGGILATKDCTCNEWKNVHDHVKSYLRKEKHWSVQDAVALSYDYLPPHLKPCFLYMAHLPEGFHIDVEKLIHMWVAEGFLFVEEEDEITTMEDIAEDYLEELIKRGMIQLGELVDSLDLEIKTCYMHDYVRELCLLKAREENFICIADKSSKDRERGITPSVAAMIGKTRRLALHETVRVECIKSPSLRTILFFEHIISDLPEDYPKGSLEEKAVRYFTKEEDKQDTSLIIMAATILFISRGVTRSIKHISNKFKKLRVLDFETAETGIFHLPSNIGNLVHLRYLSLADVAIVCKLPSSFGKLICLQTLDLRVQTVDIFMEHILFNIPDVIWRMEQLRHLYLPDKYCQFPKLRLDTLKNLQTLVNLQVDGSSIAQLGHLTNLRTLTICGSSARDIHDTKYFRCCCCCRPLKEEKFIGVKEDSMVTLGSLPNLRRLAITANAFIGERMVFSSTSFPNLESLILSSLPELNMLRVDEGALPKLHYLSISSCHQLKELPEGFRSVSTLHKVDIKDMPENFKNWWNINDQAAHASSSDSIQIEHVIC